MKTFEKEINKFLLTGTFENNIDDVNNINLFTEPVNINQQYVSYNLKSCVYDNNKISNLYDVSINEINIPTTSSNLVITEEQILASDLIVQNNNLINQLNELISGSNENSASALVGASKDIIISLRIQLGQGSSIDDFSPDFPYLKK